MESRHSNVIGCLIWDLQETSKRRTNGTLWMRTTEMSMWHTTDTSLGVSFDNCLRRRGEVLMGRRSYVLLRRRHDVPIRRHGDVPLRRLGDVPLIHRWVFHLGRTCYVAGTYRETSLQHHRDVMLPAGSSIILYSSTLAKQCWFNFYITCFIKTIKIIWLKKRNAVTCFWLYCQAIMQFL